MPEARGLAALSVGVFACLLLWVAPVRATSVLSTSLTEMAKVSDVVVLGRVTAKSERWDTAGESIYTYVTVRVDSRFKGETPADITVLVPGGRVGETARVVHGTPRFSIGEKVFLYLEARTKGDAGYNIVGLFIGKLSVKPRPAGAARAPGESAEIVDYGYPVPKIDPGDSPALVKRKTFLSDFAPGTDLRSFVFKVRADVERAKVVAP